jgi:hypothetical protein
VVSAAQQHESQQLVGDVGGGHGGHLGVVVGRGDLHHVRADQAQAGQAAQDAEQFPRRQAAGLRGAGAPNTPLFRIRRFEQLSGWSLASTEALAEVWLAMRTTAAVPEG